MIDLLRADILRLRHRGDLWIGGAAMIVLALFTYISAANGASQTNFGFPPDEQIPPDMVEQFARLGDPYTFPYAIVTMLQAGGGILAGGMALLAAAWLGSEFLWGTVRQIALIRPDRWRFVATRAIACGLLALALVLLIVALGAVLPFVIRVTGSGHPPPVSGAAVAAGAAVQWLTVLAAIGVALTFTALTRNSALGIIFTIAFFLADAVLARNPVWLGSEVLRWVPRLMLGERLRALAADATAALGPADPSGYQPPVTGLDLPAPVGLAIVVGWLALLAILPCLIVRRADIRE